MTVVAALACNCPCGCAADVPPDEGRCDVCLLHEDHEAAYGTRGDAP